MSVRIMLVAVALAACTQKPPGNVRPPDPSETPPTTADPGRVEDTPPLPPMPPPPPEGGEAAGTNGSTGSTTSTPRPDGEACLQSTDCASGICEGQGCSDDTPGRCMPKARGCTRDLRAYCGCDGKTFRASGSCPLQRYASKGTCAGS